MYTGKTVCALIETVAALGKLKDAEGGKAPKPPASSEGNTGITLGGQKSPQLDEEVDKMLDEFTKLLPKDLGDIGLGKRDVGEKCNPSDLIEEAFNNILKDSTNAV